MRAEQVDVFVAILLPLAVIIVMFSLGLGLTSADFRRIVERPRAFCIGALNQIVLLPVVAYIVILVFGFTAETAVGFMILAACPGGAASNIVTKLANWDVALSVTLTATFSLTCVATIPIVLDFAMTKFTGSAAPDVKIASTAVTTFLLATLPISVGVAFRAFVPSAAATIAPLLSKFAVVLFAGVIAGAIASNWQVVTDHFLVVGPGLFALLAVLSIIAFGTSRLLGASGREAKTIMVETGVQNGALALALAGLLVANGPAFNAFAIPAALYSVVWLGAASLALLLVALRRR